MNPGWIVFWIEPDGRENRIFKWERQAANFWSDLLSRRGCLTEISAARAYKAKHESWADYDAKVEAMCAMTV